MLRHEVVLRLHRAVLSAGLEASRTGLFAGLPAAFVGSLPHVATPAEQVLSDLDRMNAAGTLADGVTPLAVWLRNAITLAETRKESTEFRSVLEQVLGAKGAQAEKLAEDPKLPTILQPDRRVVSDIDASRIRLLANQEFSDNEVLQVVVELRRLQLRQGTEFVGRRELLRELDRLFNRKTFRFEALRRCPEQRWADRLDSAYQTEKVLRDWERNAREVAEDKHSIYVALLKEVGSYCMQMGALLFEPAVDYNSIESHIGKTTFKTRLPAEVRFPVGSDKQPKIPDEVNNPIERHRKRAVTLMNKLAKE